MAKLTTERRKELPKKDFGLPRVKDESGERKTHENAAGRGAYPMPDREHASNAKARAHQQLNEGHLSRSEYEEIVRKANRKLYGDHHS